MKKISATGLQNFLISSTEVTQELYQSVTGENPSRFQGSDRPVENVSWFDAVRFCNLLSMKEGLVPVYSVNQNPVVESWNYVPHKRNRLKGEVKVDLAASGYRLPFYEEWKVAAGGEENLYSGSSDIDCVAWYRLNSGLETHSVASKDPNASGLFDMSGNVLEWLQDSPENGFRLYAGGSFNNYDYDCEVSRFFKYHDYYQDSAIGFRICRNVE